MNDNIYFDIETAPLPQEQLPLEEMKQAAREKVPSNIKDEVKIAARYEENFAKMIESAALSATTGHVCAVGIAIGGGEPDTMIVEHHNEYDALEWFWNKITDRMGAISSRVIGFNSNAFDLPFLIRRSFAWGIKVPAAVMPLVNGRAYLSPMFIDAMQVWQCGNRTDFISLDALAKFLNVGAKNGDGKDFHKLVSAAKFDEAEAYLKNDVNLTRAVALRMGL